MRQLNVNLKKNIKSVKFFKKNIIDSYRIDYLNKISEAEVIAAYSIEDWGDLPNFAGNFINFGYWEGINFSIPISYHDRVKSSANLYDEITKQLNIDSNDTVLEVGCGRGIGGLNLAKKTKLHEFIGIDLTPEQIKKSQHMLHENKIFNSKFINANILNICFPNGYFNKIFSIEVLQHISAIEKFCEKMFYFLKPGGLLGITTYFSKNLYFHQKLGNFFPLVKENKEFIVPLPQFLNCLKRAGFAIILEKSIGNQVFPGYETWITQTNVKTPFSHHYYQAYQNNYIDYNIIICRK